MMILSQGRSYFCVSGYCLYLLSVSFGVTATGTEDNSSPKGIQEFVLYTSSLGYNLTELLLSPSLTKSAKRIKCTDFPEINICSSIFRTNVTGDIKVNILNNVLRTCHLRDTFGCLRHFVSSNSTLLEWSYSVQTSLNKFCRETCWKNNNYMSNFTCSLIPGGQDKSVSEKQVSFVMEVLDTICNKQKYDKRTCSADYINRYLSWTTSSQTKYCSVKPKSECSEECQEESRILNQTIGCCMFLAADVLKKHNITDTPAQEMIKTCHFQDDKSCLSSQVHNLDYMSDKKHISGRLVAGILISLIISSIGMFLIIRCIYQMMKRKKAARYEDYGYSQLRMMEESLYDDVEESDDELLQG